MTLPNVLPGQQATGRIPSETYIFDQENKRILRDKVDKVDAIKQFVSKTMQTNRYENLIYSFFYGFEGELLIGKQQSFVVTELPRMVREAIVFDDRIITVSDFQVKIVGDQVRASFIVTSIFGQFDQLLLFNL